MNLSTLARLPRALLLPATVFILVAFTPSCHVPGSAPPEPWAAAQVRVERSQKNLADLATALEPVAPKLAEGLENGRMALELVAKVLKDGDPPKDISAAIDLAIEALPLVGWPDNAHGHRIVATLGVLRVVLREIAAELMPPPAAAA